MYFLNLSLLQMVTVFGAVSAISVALYLLDRGRRKQIVSTLPRAISGSGDFAADREPHFRRSDSPAGDRMRSPGIFTAETPRRGEQSHHRGTETRRNNRTNYLEITEVAEMTRFGSRGSLPQTLRPVRVPVVIGVHLSSSVANSCPGVKGVACIF